MNNLRFRVQKKRQLCITQALLYVRCAECNKCVFSDQTCQCDTSHEEYKLMVMRVTLGDPYICKKYCEEKFRGTVSNPGTHKLVLHFFCFLFSLLVYRDARMIWDGMRWDWSGVDEIIASSVNTQTRSVSQHTNSFKTCMLRISKFHFPWLGSIYGECGV